MIVALFSLALLALGAHGQLSAGPVYLTPGPGGNAFPFTPGFYNGGTYQQLYANWPQGPTMLYGVSFASQATPFGGTAEYQLEVSLTTTSVGIGGLTNNFSDNLGPDHTMVFSGAISPVLAFNGTFDFTIPFFAPFGFDPAGGDLLITVFVLDATSNNPGVFGFVAGNNPDLARVYQSFGQGTPFVEAGYGLQTRFEDSPLGGAIPEPVTWVSIGSGAIILLAAARRRRVA